MNHDWPKLLNGLPKYDPVAGSKGCVFDPQAAERAIEFIETFLTFTQGIKAKQPFILEEWQKSIVANLMGWKNPDGSRRYREALIYVPRKNGKSELAAALVCLFLFTEDEPRAQLYSAAAARNQTKYVSDPVRQMIAQNPELKKRAEVYKHSVLYKGRTYQAISSEALTNHGGSTHLGIIDELHAQPNRDLVDMFQTSTGARRQPLIAYLTTADYDREGSICNTKYEYAKSIQAGLFSDPTFLPVVYEAEKDDDWLSPKVWHKANPNLGVSFPESFLANQCRQAENEPEFENTFKRLHLNLRTEQAFRWMPLHKWDLCDEEFDPSILDGMECWAGMDLASVNDMAAVVLVFHVEGMIYALPYYWCPSESAEERQRRDKVPYLLWQDQGHVEFTPGNAIDYSYIRRRINELGKRYKIKEIAFDPWNANTLAQQLANEDGFELIQFRQGWLSMNEPMKRLMTLVLTEQLRHNGNPVLRWNAANIAAVVDVSENIRPDRKHSYEKIDGMVALIMAIGRMYNSMNAPADMGSVYEKRGMILL